MTLMPNCWISEVYAEVAKQTKLTAGPNWKLNLTLWEDRAGSQIFISLFRIRILEISKLSGRWVFKSVNNEVMVGPQTH